MPTNTEYKLISPEEVNSSFESELTRLLGAGLSPELETIARRYYSQKERESMSESSFCGPHRSFPVQNESDFHNAVHLVGHADNPESVKACLKRKAKANGWKLPDSWADGDSDDRAAESDLAHATHPFDGTHSHTHSHGDMEHSHDHEHSNDGSHDHSHEMQVAEAEEKPETERADMPDTVFLHADIIRVDKTRREVTGVATSESVDSFGTIFSYDASKDAFKRWIERNANVREMHQKKAVGKGIGVRFDDEHKKIYVTTRVSRSADGDNAWTKIEEGILNGFSVGAPSTTAVWDTVTRGSKKYPYLIKYDLSELSLVDNASNPDAQGLVIARADGLTDLVDISESESVPGSVLSSPLVGSGESEQRAGARVSRESMGALHEARNTALKSAMGLMRHCNCEQCQSILRTLDPDNDGDIDFMGIDDPDHDADSLMANRSQEADLKQIETHIEETLERVFASKLTSFIQRQQSILTRFASIDTNPEVDFNPELIRSVVSTEISSLVTPLEERLNAALERLNTTSSLSEVRSVLTEVKETVERIAAQPAPGGPILNGGQPIDKRLANQPYANPNQYNPQTFWDEAQRRGLLNTPEAQMQAAAAMAIPMQSTRR